MIDITYNRSARRYEFLEPESGEILSAPPGPKNKAQLFQAALALLEPDLNDAAANWIDEEPTLERVIWRGAELVANGGVDTYPGEGMLIAKVDSSDEYGRYAVTIDGGYLACECPHWQEMGAPFASNGERICKHIAAFHLHQRSRENRF